MRSSWSAAPGPGGTPRGRPSRCRGNRARCGAVRSWASPGGSGPRDPPCVPQPAHASGGTPGAGRRSVAGCPSASFRWHTQTSSRSPLSRFRRRRRTGSANALSVRVDSSSPGGVFLALLILISKCNLYWRDCQRSTSLASHGETTQYTPGSAHGFPVHLRTSATPLVPSTSIQCRFWSQTTRQSCNSSANALIDSVGSPSQVGFILPSSPCLVNRLALLGDIIDQAQPE